MHLKTKLIYPAIAIILLALVFIIFLNDKSTDSEITPSHYDLTNYQLYKDRTSLFDLFSSQTDYIMLGDSITQRAEWSELFPQISIANRGIGRDTTYGVLNRIDQVIKLKPKKVFIMVGINDFFRKMKFEETISNYERIVQKLNHSGISVYVLSTLYTYGKNHEINLLIEKLNNHLIKYCKGNNLATFIDLNQNLSVNNQLNNTYSTDGLHLNSKGYEVWRSQLRPYIF